MTEHLWAIVSVSTNGIFDICQNKAEAKRVQRQWGAQYWRIEPIKVTRK